jgi:hypothetical protein
MIWFFRGSVGALQIETRIDPVTKDYILQIEWPGRPVVIERFRDRRSFEARVLAIEGQLTAEQWK